MIRQLVLDIIALLFPTLCSGCGLSLNQGEEVICTYCLYDLPFTDFHSHAENRVAKQLWGRLNFDAAMAMLYFKKGTKIQRLMHQLKYNGRTDVGLKLGNLLGQRLILSEDYKNIDYIIPVPLHLKKQRIRGYNQSAFIAEGIAQSLAISVNVDQLLRSKSTESQTRKSRYTRFENMESVFHICNSEKLKNKHILLVDDVITTGATLEACGNALLDSGIKKLSIAAIAFAD